MAFRKLLAVVFCLGLVATLSACDSGVQHMGTTEYGVRFRTLPRFLGGGVASANSVALPLQTVVVMPWEDIYRFDTSPQYLSWGQGMGDGGSAVKLVQDEDVYTRALDGNEAALKLTVRYRIRPEPESLITLAQTVATTSDQARDVVVAVVGAEIRTYMNQLRTAQFRDDKKRNDTVNAALTATKERLGPLGIDVEAINLKQYRFVRLLRDGKEDTSYQDRLRDIQEREQDIEGERSRIETVKAKKTKELLEAESVFNQRVSEARGFKEQSQYQGDSYYAARSNEAKAILAEGSAEAEGLRQQVTAVSGKGGQAMLRLEVAKQLTKANSKFLAVSPKAGNSGGSLDLNKIDMNQLLQQLGVAEGVAGSGPGAAAVQAAPAHDQEKQQGAQPKNAPNSEQ